MKIKDITATRKSIHILGNIVIDIYVTLVKIKGVSKWG
jgi:hypothetical protein